MLKTILTHSNSFHADECTAIALLKIFNPNTKYKIKRVAHQSILPNADYIIDIGKKLNPDLGLFDHHQYEGGLSSAGLIWKHLDMRLDYPQITELIKLVDANDVGDRKAKSHEYSRIIGAYNTKDIYNDKKQYKAFKKAIKVAMVVIQSMKDMQDQSNATDIAITISLENMGVEELERRIIRLPKYLIGWDKFLNGQVTPDLRATIWPKEVGKEIYHAQILPIKSGEYSLHGARFEPCETMDFVHANGFFCVAKDLNTMLEYLKTNHAT